jgi:hypothetical protein
VTAADIAGASATENRVEALSARKAELAELISAWEAKMSDVKIVDLVAANLSKLSSEREAVNAELAEAQREAANPFGEAWGEARTLAALKPDDDTDELRVRIKAALRRCIESVTCLFCGRKSNRMAAVRVLFKNDRARDYLFRYTAPRSNGKTSAAAKLTAYTMKQRANLAVYHDDGSNTLEFMGVDLRQQDHAARVAEILEAWDASTPLAELAELKSTPEDVARWLRALDMGCEYVGELPVLSGSKI